MKKRKSKFLHQPVQPLNLKGTKSLLDLVQAFQHTSFQSRNIFKCFEVFRKMLDDPACIIFMGLSGAMIPGRMRRVIRDMIEMKLVDVIVSTGANIFHDLFESFGYRHYIGSEEGDDDALRKHRVVRVYDALMDDSLVIGIILSYFIAKYRMGDRLRTYKAPDGTVVSKGKEADEVINFAPFAVIFGVIGARLLHVIVNWSYYAANPSYIFAFRQGGLAIQGVMVGGVLALAVFCKLRKIDFWLWADIIAPAIVLGQAIGRWGNYFNQEAFGLPTSLPWGIYIDPIYRPVAYSNSEFFHPTFFYEFLANIVLCGLLLLLHRLYKRRQDNFPDGLIFTTYLGVYAVYRTIIEFTMLHRNEHDTFISRYKKHSKNRI